MPTIPDYPPPTTPLDPTIVVAGWQDGSQRAIPVSAIAALNAAQLQALATAIGDGDTTERTRALAAEAGVGAQATAANAAAVAAATAASTAGTKADTNAAAIQAQVAIFGQTRRYAHLGRQIAFARVDRALRIRDGFFADGSGVSYVPTVPGTVTTRSSLRRYALFGQQVTFARTDRALRVEQASTALGLSYPLQPITRTRRYALLGQTVAAAVTDRALRVASAVTVGGKAWPPATASTATTQFPVLVIGDSLSAMAYGPALAAATGRTVYDPAVGGQTSRQAVIWAGFKVVPATLSGNQIVAGSNTIVQLGEYAITGMSGTGFHADNYQWLSTPADLTTRTSKVIVGTTICTVTRTAASATSETYSLVPDPGQPLPVFVPPGTPLTVIPPVDYSACTVIFRAGRNDYYMPDVVKDAVNCTIAAVPHGRIILTSILNGYFSGEQYNPAQADFTQQSQNYLTIFGLEQWLAARLPGRFWNRRRRLIDRALTAMSITATTQDNYDQTIDVPPWSLRSIESTGTTSAALTAAATSFAVTLASGALSVGTIMRIDNEFIRIDAISGASVTACVRGYGGSTAAAHASGAATTTVDKIHLASATYTYEATDDAALLVSKGY